MSNINAIHTRRPGQTSKPIALFVAFDGAMLASFNLPVMRRLIMQGWRVIGAGCADDRVSRLTEAGVEFIEIPFHRGGFLPRRDITTMLKLARLYRELNPRFIHHLQIKPVILGCAAARFSPQSTVVNLVTGLGHAYTYQGFIQRLATAGYRLTLGRAAATIFENPDDRRQFLAKGLVREDTSEVIVSTGVDPKRFQPAAGAAGLPLRVVLPSRLLWAKGIGEFVEAARLCRQTWPNVRFQIAGGLSTEHPDGVPQQQVDQWVAEGLIEHLGFVRNMEELYQNSTIVVLPSYYREGCPRVLMEAAACGVPVITCDTPGCREPVDHGVTGLLVPPKDSHALASAIGKLLSDDKLRSDMGRAGRKRTERLFDHQAIVAKHLDFYRRIGITLDKCDDLSTRRLLAG